jgi:hypothetical protein
MARRLVDMDWSAQQGKTSALGATGKLTSSMERLGSVEAETPSKESEQSAILLIRGPYACNRKKTDSTSQPSL